MAVQIKADEITEIIRSQIQDLIGNWMWPRPGSSSPWGRDRPVYGLEGSWPGTSGISPWRFRHGPQPGAGQRGAVLFGEDKLIKKGTWSREPSGFPGSPWETNSSGGW